MVDELNRLINGGISTSKDPSQVSEIILKRWCLRGLGYPSREFYADNGGEFKGEYKEPVYP